jgi:hypothetical protein
MIFVCLYVLKCYIFNCSNITNHMQPRMRTYVGKKAELTVKILVCTTWSPAKIHL